MSGQLARSLAPPARIRPWPPLPAHQRARMALDVCAIAQCSRHRAGLLPHIKATRCDLDLALRASIGELRKGAPGQQDRTICPIFRYRLSSTQNLQLEE